MTDVDRYYQTVLLTIGLKEFLEQNDLGCRFVSAEPCFFEVGSQKEIFPDVVLQYDNDKFGILCEIKTSLPAVDHFLLEELKQVQLYSGQVEGWYTSNKKVNDHSIILLCHAVDSDRLVEKVSHWTNNGELKISKKLCIAEWSIVESLKYEQRDVILVRHRLGDSGCSALDTKLRQNLRLELDKLLTIYEKCRFTRKEPPIEYVMYQLWNCIFPALQEKAEDFTCGADELLKVAYDYFIPWSGLQGEYSQIRKKWIRKAMDAFCNIELAERLQSVTSGSSQDSYNIFYGRRIQKDMSDYVVERLCQRDIEEARKRPIKEALEEAQRKLVEFDQKNL